MGNRYIDWHNEVGIPDGRLYPNDKCLPFFVILWKSLLLQEQKVQFALNLFITKNAISTVVDNYKMIAIPSETFMTKLSTLHKQESFNTHKIPVDERFFNGMFSLDNNTLALSNSRICLQTLSLIQIINTGIKIYKEHHKNSFDKKCLVSGLQAPTITLKSTDEHTKYVEYLKVIQESAAYQMNKWGSDFNTNLIFIHIK